MKIINLIIIIAPIIPYYFYYLKFNRIIASRIKENHNRKAYKKYFNQLYAESFGSLLLITPIVVSFENFSLNQEDYQKILSLILAIVRIGVLLSALFLAKYTYPKFKKELQKLKIENEEALMKSLENIK